MKLTNILEKLIAHASGDNPPQEVQEAIHGLQPLLEGLQRAQISDSFGPFANVAEFIDQTLAWAPDDVADWITHGARKKAVDCWESHIAEGWTIQHLCEADLDVAIGQLITWRDRLYDIR